MYELAYILNRNNIETKIACSTMEIEEIKIPKKYRDFFISYCCLPESVSDNDIVIYPETVPNNPLNAKKIVRWLLNNPYVFYDGFNFGSNELLVSYSKLISNQMPQLFIMKDDRLLIKQYINEKKVKCEVSLYLGKLVKKDLIKDYEKLRDILSNYKKINVITRNYPKNKEEVLEMISRSELLISYDSISNINYEAALLKTPVLFMTDYLDIKNKEYNVPIKGYYFSYNNINNDDMSNNYSYYCEWFEKEEDSILNSIKVIVSSINEIYNNENERKKNAIKNRQYLDELKRSAKLFKHIKLDNIAFIEDIPDPIYSLLTKKKKTKLQKNIKDWLKNKYLNIKPKWCDEMYKKIPTSLTFKELKFLETRLLLSFFTKKFL